MNSADKIKVIVLTCDRQCAIAGHLPYPCCLSRGRLWPLQTVHANTSPLYHRLISEFSRLTSIPMVLNTSFNENEPVVCCPKEAFD
jgi:hypothetical protein